MTSKPPAQSYRRYPRETRGAMLVDAGSACLARGGITAFTVENICREAQVSRGLIGHHFGTKDALLAAVYASMYERFMEVIALPDEEELSAAALVEACVAPEVFNPDSLRTWLALWGEIANNAELRAEHRLRYRDFLDRVERIILAEARRRSVEVDARSAALQFVALSDGLWLEHAIDTSMLSRSSARDALFEFLENALGGTTRDRAR
ncbi:TetR family transcriptional regulator C-terminal domain-containing protein [Sulfitobacter sp. LCG007]